MKRFLYILMLLNSYLVFSQDIPEKLLLSSKAFSELSIVLFKSFVSDKTTSAIVSPVEGSCTGKNFVEELEIDPLM